MELTKNLGTSSINAAFSISGGELQEETFEGLKRKLEKVAQEKH